MTQHYQVYEFELTAARQYDNPLWEAGALVTFTSPSGGQQRVDAFWDGGTTWRVRFSPDTVGTWYWETASADPGMDAQEGRFDCTPYSGDNPLYTHGSLRVATDGTHLEHADGTPFFWMGDTAWNGVIRAAADDWERYLQTRRAQRFNVIQFVSTQWRAAAAADAFSGDPTHIHINPAFFGQRDALVAAINAHGMLAAPVLLWTYTAADPGQTLSEESCIRLARYIIARWGAYQVAWFLGGDGDFTGEAESRWQRIGRAVFAERDERLATLHPCGWSWPDFRSESWYDFIGYQSGHSTREEQLHWLTQGPPATDWDRDPRLPIINLEPNYDLHPGSHGEIMGEHHVRRASYWSLLVSPTAGISYGNNGIWPWQTERGPAEGHKLEAVPWHEGLDTAGIRSMTRLRALFETLPWWTLRPAQHLLAAQADDVREFIAAAETRDQAVIFTPVAQAIRLRTPAASARWYDPLTGDWHEAGSGATFQPPADDGDWVLVVGK